MQIKFSDKIKIEKLAEICGIKSMLDSYDDD